MRRALHLAMAVLAFWSAPLSAQASGSGAGQPAAQRGARREAGQGERALLERRVRERMARVVRQRLGLNDQQMRRLQETNRRFEGQRVDVARRERDARIRLRAELARPAAADQEAVDTLIATLLRMQRERHSLVEDEQRALRAFLTPVQRAQYLALQEQLRRRVEEARQGAARRAGAATDGDATP
jgi:hypothetical protein